jgi:protein-S-isoprenylcysteine O-methyltransferase Ste14
MNAPPTLDRLESAHLAQSSASELVPKCLVLDGTWSRQTQEGWQARKRFAIPTRVLRFLAKPWVDKAIGALVCYPCASLAYTCLKAGLMNIPRALFFAEMALFVLTMLIRRNPLRITADPRYWAVAFLATYYGLLIPGLVRGGAVIVPASACNSLAVLGFWTAIFARLSLGRNIGLVPAQRKIVTGGAYRYMRHPIYTAHFLCSLAFCLSCYSLLNAIAIGIGCGLWVVKTFMEESFLSRDPEYAAYMERVRWRWFPGLL